MRSRLPSCLINIGTNLTEQLKKTTPENTVIPIMVTPRPISYHPIGAAPVKSCTTPYIIPAMETTVPPTAMMQVRAKSPTRAAVSANHAPANNTRVTEVKKNASIMIRTIQPRLAGFLSIYFFKRRQINPI